MPADRESFRRFMAHVPQAVTIITLKAGEVEHGMTASSIAGVSMDPMLFLVCVARTAPAHDLMPVAGGFVVNVLAHDQADACTVFADDDLADDQRWPHVTTHRGPSGVPRVDGCVGYLECRLADAFPGGTHTIYVGEVSDVAEGTGTEPMVWYEREAHRLAGRPQRPR